MSYRRRSRATYKNKLEAEAAIHVAAARRKREEESMRWTSARVAGRLHEAMRTIAETVASPRPKEFGNAWPDALKEQPTLVELIESIANPDLFALENHITRCARSEEITRAEEAIYWPGRYLVDKWPGPNNVLRVWMRAVAGRRSIRKAMADAGYSRATADGALDRAFSVISEGLNADGVVPK